MLCPQRQAAEKKGGWINKKWEADVAPDVLPASCPLQDGDKRIEMAAWGWHCVTPPAGSPELLPKALLVAQGCSAKCQHFCLCAAGNHQETQGFVAVKWRLQRALEITSAFKKSREMWESLIAWGVLLTLPHSLKMQKKTPSCHRQAGKICQKRVLGWELVCNLD